MQNDLSDRDVFKLVWFHRCKHKIWALGTSVIARNASNYLAAYFISQYVLRYCTLRASKRLFPEDIVKRERARELISFNDKIAYDGQQISAFNVHFAMLISSI